jgi:hypothetical protein
VFCLVEDNRVMSKEQDSFLLFHRRDMLKLGLENNSYTSSIDLTCMFGILLVQHWKNFKERRN